MASIGELLTNAQQQLVNSESAQLDAEVLLAFAINKSRAYLRGFAEQQPSAEQRQHFSLLIARRVAGEPVAHLIGEREFWSLSFKVSADTLIPRPETELLVEQALTIIPDNADSNYRLADLGTGSGAIAIAIASERPQASITACDLSTAALAIAVENAEHHNCNIEFRHSNWCSAFAADEKFDLIISNPPYIPASDPHMQSTDLQHEPVFALASGEDGLDAIRLIAEQAQKHLNTSGWLLIEHGYDQAESVRNLLASNGYRHIETVQDIEHRDRLCRAKCPQAKS